mmetsp:Transcript_10789/g.27284  ORF Transcript_10789/g.27284 Transcript_10789/m.27284 type:complete len:267 (+) Transcript_10789:247-1047(+)|eukprot:CAMPEP_0177676662 /NCGR_PEP_ID=MMETSP0447-20121125/27928_1 /TAXON_ID=0 /ORGANISM="Stygamoeba regulata, Strain BSH-02190019" /LENGTH=266 /DNA_ID=CAMNT_0019185279 /DNA_START=240 /DNA_END=1040 /DNA_ORIENTATION=+
MALLIVKKLRDLCANPANRSHIVNNDSTTISGLVVFLRNEDEEVVFTALEAINFLARNAEHRQALAKVTGLVDQVQSLMFSSFSTRVKRMSISTYTLLQDAVSSDEKKGAEAKQKGKGAAAAETPKPIKKPAATHTVYVQGLTTEPKRKEVESILLRKKGVISFLIDLFSQKITIRSTLTVHELVKHINQSCSMLASTKEFQEVEDKENVSHDYLDEEVEKASKQEGKEGWFGWGSQQQKSTSIMVNDSSVQQSGWFGRISKSLWG